MKQIIILAGLSSAASAAVVSGTITLSSDDPFAAFSDYGVYTEVDEFGAGWLFNTIDIDTFEIDTYTIGAGFTYYQLPFGTRVGQNELPDGPIIVSNVTPPDPAFFDIPDGDSIFLALEFNDGVDVKYRTYGWIELENNGGIVTSGGSATAFDSGGIIVGTTLAIPEPSSAILLLASSLLMLSRSRRR